MKNPYQHLPFELLARDLEGELHTDNSMRTLFATDASAYREMPAAVAFPKCEKDIARIIRFANQHSLPLIPRTAGTSLAGQVVGSGLIVDVSRHLTRILEVNETEGWVKVQPGVVRDELNQHLKDYNLFFGPETSTANRAMIGGMVGNNSCGSNSVVYGSAREHLMEVRGFLSNGEEVVFKDMDPEELFHKLHGDPSLRETAIYQNIHQWLLDKETRREIEREFPKPSIPRRNTGYAVDLLARLQPFNLEGAPFNFCKLIAGSEGTLMFITEIKLHCDPLPPKYKGLVCAHFNTVDEALHANLTALKFNPSACELMDHYVLECTKNNREQSLNRFFVEGDPGAILVVEISRDSNADLHRDSGYLIEAFKEKKQGYHYTFVTGEDIKRVWTLRKAGLGLLSNIPGDAKPVAVIEDTAVDVNDLPAFIRDFNETLKQYDLYCVHYAHAGSGELHLRPIINLKTEDGNKLFRAIAQEIAHLVKKYKGSLSGEHGDGRLRGEFIPFMIGEKNYQLIEKVKHLFDPENLFNPKKIVRTPPMNTSLRYEAGQQTPKINTIFDWSDTQGILRHAEQCNGSGDCRKTHLSGGTMCPSYMATRHEKDTTRARANMLREVFTNKTEAAAFASEEVKEVLDLCLSCKACKSECPSNVDMAKLKAEFMQRYQEKNGVSFRTWNIAHFTRTHALASLTPRLYNFMMNGPFSKLIKQSAGFATERSIPKLHPKYTLKSWFKKYYPTLKEGKTSAKKVCLFADEFTNFQDVEIGITTIKLLDKLGYEVIFPPQLESGRTFLSKGLVKKAKSIAIRNVDLLSAYVSEEVPLIGIEPSALLTIRDEYLSLCSDGQRHKAQVLAANSYLLEEFLATEMEKGFISEELFTEKEQLIKLHGHCHQKALSSLVPVKKLLSLPANYMVQLIPSGCCGMAGSFGYEAEHYETSMQVGELVLFPTVREQPHNVIIAAAGTSCRHQIKDGTGREALHPAEILWEALR